MRTKRIKKNRLMSGLTLTELMVANAIAIMAFVVLFYVAFTIQDNIGITSGVLGISEKGRFAIDLISKGIREAESVVSSYSSYTTDNDTIVLKVPAINTSGNVLLGADGSIAGYDTIVYELQSSNVGNIIRHIVADIYYGSSRAVGSWVIADEIDSLSFSSGGTALASVTDKPSIETVTVKVITTATTSGVSRQNEVATSVSLRNK